MANGQQPETAGEATPEGIAIDRDAIRVAFRDLHNPSRPASAEASASTTAPEARAPAVDLAAWARGEEDHPWAMIESAIRQYGFKKVEEFADRYASIEEPADAVQFLIDEGLIDEEESRLNV